MEFQCDVAKVAIEIAPWRVIVTVIAPQLDVRYSGILPIIVLNRFCLLVSLEALELMIHCGATAARNAGVESSLLP